MRLVEGSVGDGEHMMSFRKDCFRKFDYGVALRADQSGSSTHTVVIIMKSLISPPAFIYVNSTYFLHLALPSPHHLSPFL